MIKIGTHSMSMFSENMENSAVFINLISTIIHIHIVIWHLYNFWSGIPTLYYMNNDFFLNMEIILKRFHFEKYPNFYYLKLFFKYIEY